MPSYTGYQGYGSPERAKVDRARQMAELLQQGATDTSPKSFWEGAAQLGKAFIARDAMGKAEKAETEYGDNQKKALALFLSQKPFGSADAAAAVPSDPRKRGEAFMAARGAPAPAPGAGPEAPISNVAQMAETLAMTSPSPDAAMQSPAPAMTPPPAMAQASTMAPAPTPAQPQGVSSKIANMSNLLMGNMPERVPQAPQAPQMDINAMVEQHFATTGDVQGAMALGRELQRQQLEDRRYVDDKNYTRRVDARNFRQSADQFGVTSGLQRDQLGQDATQHTATMAQNASQFGVTSGLSAAELAEKKRQFDAELALKQAEADAKTSGDAVFDGPQLATIYNKSMSELDEARARQAQLDTIANASISFMDVVKGDDWLQGAGPLNDMMQAGSTRTSEAKKLTDTIAPLIRMPGSGGNSDTDVAMFKNSVVNVNNTPQSNKLATEQAVALQQRGQQYVNYLTRTIDPRDPQSKQKADAMWNIYKQENSIFDPQSGKVKTVPTFDDWLDIKMGNKPPPPPAAPVTTSPIQTRTASGVTGGGQMGLRGGSGGGGGQMGLGSRPSPAARPDQQPIDLSRLTPEQLDRLERQLNQGGGR